MTTPPPLVVIDAANVIGSRPDGWWRDRAGAAARLLDTLRAGLTDDPDAELVLVLEGVARAGAEQGDHGEVRVVHAAGSGDDAIAELVAAATSSDPARPVVVVTADRGLRGRVEIVGAATHGPSWLRRQLTQ